MDEGDNLILLDGADEGGEELRSGEAALSREDNAQEGLDMFELDKGLDTVESPGRETLAGERAAERSE